MLPSQLIMDNGFFYGEFRIIGNRPVVPEEWEPVISYSKRIRKPKNFTYLQYGLICKTSDKEYMYEPEWYEVCRFSNEAIGFGINHYSRLEEIITHGVDNDSLLSKNDIRKKSNRKEKKKVFRLFGLDADKTYAENLSIAQHNDPSGNSGIISTFINKLRSRNSTKS